MNNKAKITNNRPGASLTRKYDLFIFFDPFSNNSNNNDYNND